MSIFYISSPIDDKIHLKPLGGGGKIFELRPNTGLDNKIRSYTYGKIPITIK